MAYEDDQHIIDILHNINIFNSSRIAALQRGIIDALQKMPMIVGKDEAANILQDVMVGNGDYYVEPVVLPKPPNKETTNERN